MPFGFSRVIGAMLLVFGLATTGHAQSQFGNVIRVDRQAFKSDAGLITFSEFRQGTRNPTYRPADYRADPGGVTVFFGGFFLGQSKSRSGQCPRGANLHGCVAGDPMSPLQIDPRSPVSFIQHDGSNPRSPSLSGSPMFNGPVSMVFDRDVAGVGLVGGYFNVRNSTAIRAFDRNGNLIGGVKNLRVGMEFLALVTEDGSDLIAGIQFSLVGAEPAGYAIDDVNFALAKQIDRGQVPGLAEVLPSVVGEKKQEAGGGLADLFSTPKANAEAIDVTPTPEKEPKKEKGASSLSDFFN